ncbi:hypothetical protein B0T20DRAFT_273878 [Sordaria brevicollis]|uniref:Uncharacterized protein n=1 Tax=Sordaria brevicollis TaxID=83679 RepID=A0AAE0UA68_SORBR|nr:hypothetical protein B0T20DRAFT_273878 [Sordaria brevicollis]
MTTTAQNRCNTHTIGNTVPKRPVPATSWTDFAVLFTAQRNGKGAGWLKSHTTVYGGLGSHDAWHVVGYTLTRGYVRRSALRSARLLQFRFGIYVPSAGYSHCSPTTSLFWIPLSLIELVGQQAGQGRQSKGRRQRAAIFPLLFSLLSFILSFEFSRRP